MTDKDVVLAKIATIQRCLKRISQVTGSEPSSLNDIDRQDIFVLNLQRAVQAVIDLATHIVAEQGMGLPDTLKENFRLLQQNNVISVDLDRKLEKMVGFRNIAVHDYQAIDEKILKSILQHNLKDLEDFYIAVLHYFGWSGEA